MNIHSIFNRLFFCDSCFFSETPFSESKVLVYIEREKVYYLYRLEEVEKSLNIMPSVRGFTPHIVQLEALIQEDEPLVEYTMTCGICGIELISNPPKGLKAKIKKQDTYITRLDIWEDIVNNRL